MTMKEASELKSGDFVRIINTHKDKVTTNDECVWMVEESLFERKGRSPLKTFSLKLVLGNYYDWRTNEIINHGDVIVRTNRALQKLDIES